MFNFEGAVATEDAVKLLCETTTCASKSPTGYDSLSVDCKQFLGKEYSYNFSAKNGGVVSQTGEHGKTLYKTFDDVFVIEWFSRDGQSITDRQSISRQSGKFQYNGPGLDLTGDCKKVDVLKNKF